MMRKLILISCMLFSFYLLISPSYAMWCGWCDEEAWSEEEAYTSTPVQTQKEKTKKSLPTTPLIERSELSQTPYQIKVKETTVSFPIALTVTEESDQSIVLQLKTIFYIRKFLNYETAKDLAYLKNFTENKAAIKADNTRSLKHKLGLFKDAVNRNTPDNDRNISLEVLGSLDKIANTFQTDDPCFPVYFGQEEDSERPVIFFKLDPQALLIKGPRAER